MEKTKLGIPVALMGALLCLLCYYGGYVATALVVGYVLLVEENASLKKLAVRMLTLLLTFSLLNTAIYLIPNVLSVFRFYWDGLNRFVDFLSNILGLAKTVLCLLLGYFALTGKEFEIPVLDKKLEKLLNKQED